MSNNSKKDSAAKIYTRTGDKGQTSLIGGTRVVKSDERLEAYGTIDELNSFIGCLRSELSETDVLNAELERIQNTLFNAGSQLACEDKELRKKLPTIGPDAITDLESRMDAMSLKLSPLTHFILPGGTPAAGFAHLARTVCRRAERHCVAVPDTDEILIKYINRLSDYFFVCARYLNSQAGVAETLWKS